MFNKGTREVFNNLNTSTLGLTKEEAKVRLLKNGENKLDEPKKIPFIIKFLEKFKDFLIIVLLFAAAISVAISVIEQSTAELFDAVLILTVVLVNSAISLLQESKADKAIESLKKLTSPYAKVVRAGKTIKIKAEEIVVGDIVVLEAGDIVPADLRLFEVASLKIEESALTGESAAVEKFTQVIEEGNPPLGNRFNMAYMGTVVSYGRAKGIVTGTGMDTEIGKIANALITIKIEKTPLTKKIDKLSKLIGAVVLFVSIAIFVLGLIRGDNLVHAFMISVAIAVCAIPEGLPAAVTVTLAIGVEEMSKQKAIVKKLPAVETLGGAEVICSDKTGTLTLNKMIVKQVYVSNIASYYKNLLTKNKLEEQLIGALKKNKNFSSLMHCMLLCNDSQLKYENELLVSVGDPTETALAHFGYENGYSKEQLEGAYPRIDEIPFDSNRKLMTTIHKKEDKIIAYTKGALDNLLTKCKYVLYDGQVKELTEYEKNKILKVNSIYASFALRMLGFAYKPLNKNYNKQNVEQELIFIGIAGMMDPPRPEVYEAIKTCKKAGILPIMITGDHKETAFAIAKELGIATSIKQVITGSELDLIDDEALVKKIDNFKVYARVNPEHKVRIVNAFKALDKIVAMTGDGVNDAPSLKAAHIGVGMGISGTDVTKGVADIVLTDDNFATIISAVKEGRKVYSNILKILQFLLTTGLAEVILMMTIIVFMGRSFFAPALILWINFVSDTLSALALGTEPPEADIMDKPPIKDRGNILLSPIGVSIVYTAILQASIIFGLYFYSLEVLQLSTITTITMCFIGLVIMELFHSYNLRSENDSLVTLKMFSNKYINYAFIISLIITSLGVILPIPAVHQAFGITSLTLFEWAVSIGFAFLVIPGVELIKVFKRKNLNKNT